VREECPALRKNRQELQNEGHDSGHQQKTERSVKGGMLEVLSWAEES
jgi:hypothetical protein